jgi:hypothetical protein
MTLSKAQQRVIDLMQQGWELGTSQALDSRSWLQKDGIGRGGDTEDVHGSTFHALYVRKLIELNGSDFPSQRWRLTAAGKSIVTPVLTH